MATTHPTPLQAVQLWGPALTRTDEQDIDASVATLIREKAREAVAAKRQRDADDALIRGLQLLGPHAVAASIVNSREAFRRTGYTLGPDDSIPDEQMAVARDRAEQGLLRVLGNLALVKRAKRGAK